MTQSAGPPKRRIYANGYYSDWFEIKSGVAQGCPLSALLFLVVAEGLRISLEMESGFKGIEIGGTSYPISQFADDTTLMMGDTEEIPHAEKGLRRYGPTNNDTPEEDDTALEEPDAQIDNWEAEFAADLEAETELMQ